MGGTNAEYGRGLDFDSFENVYTTGNYSGTPDFNPSSGTYTIPSSGANDGFVQKMNQCKTSSSIVVNACDSYVSPSGNYYWSSNGTYFDTIREDVIAC
jgi:hypothetical protein